MTAARYDLIIDQGSDFSLELVIKENGQAKDLTGWHGRAALRKTLEQGSTSADFVVTIPKDSDGYTQSGSDLGKVNISLPFSVSAALTAATYHYDLEIFENGATGPTGGIAAVTRVIGGTATVRREVTR